MDRFSAEDHICGTICNDSARLGEPVTLDFRELGAPAMEGREVRLSCPQMSTASLDLDVTESMGITLGLKELRERSTSQAPYKMRIQAGHSATNALVAMATSLNSELGRTGGRKLVRHIPFAITTYVGENKGKQRVRFDCSPFTRLAAPPDFFEQLGFEDDQLAPFSQGNEVAEGSVALIEPSATGKRWIDPTDEYLEALDVYLVFAPLAKNVRQRFETAKHITVTDATEGKLALELSKLATQYCCFTCTREIGLGGCDACHRSSKVCTQCRNRYDIPQNGNTCAGCIETLCNGCGTNGVPQRDSGRGYDYRMCVSCRTGGTRCADCGMLFKRLNKFLPKRRCRGCQSRVLRENRRLCKKARASRDRPDRKAKRGKKSKVGRRTIKARGRARQKTASADAPSNATGTTPSGAAQTTDTTLTTAVEVAVAAAVTDATGGEPQGGVVTTATTSAAANDETATATENTEAQRATTAPAAAAPECATSAAATEVTTEQSHCAPPASPVSQVTAPATLADLWTAELEALDLWEPSDTQTAITAPGAAATETAAGQGYCAPPPLSLDSQLLNTPSPLWTTENQENERPAALWVQPSDGGPTHYASFASDKPTGEPPRNALMALPQDPFGPTQQQPTGDVHPVQVQPLTNTGITVASAPIGFRPAPATSPYDVDSLDLDTPLFDGALDLTFLDRVPN